MLTMENSFSGICLSILFGKKAPLPVDEVPWIILIYCSFYVGKAVGSSCGCPRVVTEERRGR